jgi:hypothetical protein
MMRLDTRTRASLRARVTALEAEVANYQAVHAGLRSQRNRAKRRLDRLNEMWPVDHREKATELAEVTRYGLLPALGGRQLSPSEPDLRATAVERAMKLLAVLPPPECG